MPYGLKDEEFNKIQNEVVKKLYEIPNLDRPAFLVGCTEQELRKAMTELRKTPKSRGKIEAVERELRIRGNKNKKQSFSKVTWRKKDLRGNGRKRVEE